MGRLSMSTTMSTMGLVRQRYPWERVSGALKSEDTVMDLILGTASLWLAQGTVRQKRDTTYNVVRPGLILESE